MDRIQVNGVELEVEVQGSGEPVLLIHPTIIGDAFAPLIAEPALKERYSLISYHRRGYGGSTHPAAPVSIGEQAADAGAVLRQLGLNRAHVVGHSYGGTVALQLALDAPEAVHSLALLEPGLLMVPSAQQLGQAIGPIVETYMAGDKAAAIGTFIQRVLCPRDVLDRVMPAGWFEQAVADADASFGVDLPSLQAWTFTEEPVRRITRPVLNVLGTDSVPVFVEVHELLRQWLPQAEPFVLPGATHALQMMNPRGMADALAGFFARHPLAVAA